MALTDMRIKALKPRDKRYTVADEKGLSIEVYPTGGALWHFRYRLAGKAERVTLGRYPDLSLKLARAKRDEAATQVALGKSPAVQKRLAKAANEEGQTVAAFAPRFFREVVSKDRKNVTSPLRYFNKQVLPAIGTKAVCDVDTEDVRSIIWRKKDEGFDAAAGELRGVLKRFFDFALTCGLTRSNPVLGLPMRHVHKARARTRALSPEEIGTFLAAVYASNVRRQFKVALHLVLVTMVRKSELLRSTWNEIDFKNAEWHIPANHSKTGRPHMVFLSRQAVELFEQLKTLAAGSELVMPGRGSLTKPFAHNALNNALKVALTGQDIPAFTIHDLRRTASTQLHEQGWASDIVEKALNHSIGGVRGVYNRAEYASQRRVMLQSWADFIGLLLEPKARVLYGRFDRAA